MNEATVRRFRARFTKNPAVLLQLGLFEIIGRAKDDEYRCLVCGDQVLGRLEIERHVLAHYVDEPDVEETPRAVHQAAAMSGPALADMAGAPEAGEQPSVELEAEGRADTAIDPPATQHLGTGADMESLVSQLSSNPALARMLSDALELAARAQHEAAVPLEEDTGSQPESLTLGQARLRRSAERHGIGGTGLEDDHDPDDASAAARYPCRRRGR